MQWCIVVDCLPVCRQFDSEFTKPCAIPTTIGQLDKLASMFFPIASFGDEKLGL